MGRKVNDILITFVDGSKARIDKAQVFVGNESMPIVEFVVGNLHYIYPLMSIKSISFKEESVGAGASTGRYPWSK